MKGFQSKSLHSKTEIKTMKVYRPYYVHNGRKVYLETCISEKETQWALKQFTTAQWSKDFSWESTNVEISEENMAVLYIEFSHYKDDFTSDFVGVSFDFPKGKWERVSPNYWKDSQGNHVKRFILPFKSLTRREQIEKELDEMYLQELSVMEEISNAQE